MSGFSLLKKPKIEAEENEEEPEEEDPREESNDEDTEEQIRNEQEEALVALIEHREKEVEHLRQRITYYKSQLADGERRLEDTKSKLARLRGHNMKKASKTLMNGREEVKVERSPSPIKISNSSTKQSKPHQHDIAKSSGDIMRARSSPLLKKGDSSQSKPPLVMPTVNPSTSQPIKKEPGNKFTGGSGSLSASSKSSPSSGLTQVKQEKTHMISSERDSVDAQSRGIKRKLEQKEVKEHKDLIKMINKGSSPVTIRCQTDCLVASQHKRKLRSLVLCPTNDQLFVTSSLDGFVNLWQVQGRGSSASLLSSTDCQSDKQRRWPEDLAWHPQGNKLFSVYTADGGDSQISILNLNKGKGQGKARVIFLPDKPHTKGIINSITFTPWDDELFLTGGSDHAVVLWKEKDGEDQWKPKTLHRHYHSSAVMGVAAMQRKNIVMSAGADKRIFGYDIQCERVEYKHTIDSKCMSVVPNPCDFNLFMVQTGTPERQLRLFDLRLRQVEIHSFGWKQESSDSQSALINQAWSPDGLYITSGSTDPTIHIFDIRYNARKPSQSIRAHQKRVFKAAWHHALPILISISSDLNIGLHRII